MIYFVIKVNVLITPNLSFDHKKNLPLLHVTLAIFCDFLSQVDLTVVPYLAISEKPLDSNLDIQLKRIFFYVAIPLGWFLSLFALYCIYIPL